jgi:hypothetical protein
MIVKRFNKYFAMMDGDVCGSEMLDIDIDIDCAGSDQDNHLICKDKGFLLRVFPGLKGCFGG